MRRPLWQAEVPPGPDALSAPGHLSARGVPMSGQTVQNKGVQELLSCGEGIRGGVPALCYPDTDGPRPRRILVRGGLRVRVANPPKR